MEELERFLLLDQEVVLGECWEPSSETPIQDYTDFMDLLEDQRWWLADFPSTTTTTTVISSSSHESPKLAGEDHEAAILKDKTDDELLWQSSFVLDPQELEEQQEQTRKPPMKCQEEDHQQQVDIEVFRKEEDEDDPESEEEEDKKSDGVSNSKNLQSERNRRKRLNQQLFTLRSLVPNITKMDKRSILVDALAYLQSIHQEVQNLTEETRSELSSSWSPTTSLSPSIEFEPDHQPAIPAPYQRCATTLPEITKMNAEMLDADRFILEIVCNKAIGALSQVQRSIEMLGIEITCTSLSELIDQKSMVTTTFIRVKKNSRLMMTPDKLLNRLRLNAKQLGLHVHPGS
ncbi:hypothetical protein Syun_008630 [Stephania yunnanensis]|uniref:BHLH domain-containing protein n=1 Tax=Stephania yunnanensis TaxID=152371 RepID=A0AAP0KCX3_9MAGN